MIAHFFGGRPAIKRITIFCGDPIKEDHLKEDHLKEDHLREDHLREKHGP
jgi:hypothetical protein